MFIMLKCNYLVTYKKQEVVYFSTYSGCFGGEGRRFLGPRLCPENVSALFWALCADNNLLSSWSFFIYWYISTIKCIYILCIYAQYIDGKHKNFSKFWCLGFDDFTDSLQYNSIQNSPPPRGKMYIFHRPEINYCMYACRGIFLWKNLALIAGQ
jgi:hypothetical protein